MIKEYVTQHFPGFNQAQIIYMIANYGIYAYTVYSCANNYYKTANTAFRICRAGYVISGSMYNKWLRWKYKQTKPTTNVKLAPLPSKEVEMTDTIVTTTQPIVQLVPAPELHDFVENYFVTSPS